MPSGNIIAVCTVKHTKPINTKSKSYWLSKQVGRVFAAGLCGVNAVCRNTCMETWLRFSSQISSALNWKAAFERYTTLFSCGIAYIHNA
jgi:hypothetical protein